MNLNRLKALCVCVELGFLGASPTDGCGPETRNLKPKIYYRVSLPLGHGPFLRCPFHLSAVKSQQPSKKSQTEKKKKKKRRETGRQSWEEWDFEEMGIDLTDGEGLREGR